MTARLPLRKRLRRIVLYSLVLLLVTAAVLMSLLRLVISDVETYRLDIERIASTFLEQPVRIEALDARFSGLTPTLVFRNVRLLDKAGKRELVRFDEARLGIAVWGSLRAEKIVPAEFIIENIQLAVTRLPSGDISIQGLDLGKLGETAAQQSTQANGGLADWLFHRSRLALHNSTVLWQDQHRGGARRRFEEVNISLANDGDRHRLKGTLGLPAGLGRRLELAFDFEGDMTRPASWHGQFYTRGDSIHLHEWQKELPVERQLRFQGGTLDIKLWGELEAGQLVRLSGDTAVYNLALQAPLLKDTLSLNMAGGLFDFRRHGRDWSLALEQLQFMSANSIWPASRLSILHRARPGDEVGSVDLRAEYFRLEDVRQLLLQTRLLDKQLARRLQVMQPAGDIRQLWFRSDYAAGKLQAPYQLQGRFHQLAAQPDGRLPGAHGLNGNFWLDQDRARLQLESDFATLKLPALFRKPLQLTRLATVLDGQRLRGGWQLRAERLIAETADLKTRSRLQFDTFRDGSSPYLDIQTRFSAPDVSRASDYYPVGIMPAPLLAWLDQAFRAGTVPAGAMLFNGRLKAFPFAHGEGRFLTRFETDKLDLHYKAGWPLLRQLQAEVSFSGTGMQAQLRRGKVFNSRLGPGRVTIPAFRKAELQVEGTVTGGLQDVARFLTESPIAPAAREFVAASRIDGEAHSRFRFHLPLSRKAAAPAGYDGRLQISNGAVYLLDEKIDVTALNGEVLFSEQGETGRNITGRILGHPARFELFAQPQAGKLARSVVATTRQDSARLLSRLGLRPGKRVTGETGVQAVLVLAPDSAGKVQPVLNITSDLEGVEVNMPQPLGKKAEEIRSLATTLRFHPHHTGLLLNYADRFCSALRLQDKSLKGVTVHFGAGVPQLPQRDELKITGSISDFSYAEWRKLVHDMGPQRKQRTQPGPIVLDMQALGLRKSKPEQHKEVLSPAEVPLINGRIRKFAYAGIDLGQLVVATARLRYGMRISKLGLTSANLQLQAKGNWIHRRRSDTTTLEFTAHSPDSGKLLEQLGYAATIRQGKLQTSGTLSWPDRPDRFDAAKLVGNVRLSIKDGNLREVQAGAGRLLGLFSLSALPRRLTLDFRDTFKSGFSFDEISGNLEIRNGKVTTRRLQAESPVAEIIVEGRTDYLAKTLDHTVVVIPKLSDTLPVAGGLLFGLQVGAVIAVLDKIMGKEINKASMRRYHISGPWDEPVIRELEAPQPAEAAAEDE